jgi:hypothetical protein
MRSTLSWRILRYKAKVRFIDKVNKLFVLRMEAVTADTRKIVADTDRLLASASDN